MSTTVAGPSGTAAIAASTAAALLLIVMSLVAILSALIGQNTCAGAAGQAAPSEHAERGIPERYLVLYRQAGRRYGVPWPVLAAIGSIETDHGRSPAPGVRSGVNNHGCCAGPMQFNLHDGRTSTWERYGVDGNRDGKRDVYDPSDAIASAANYLHALLRDADGDLHRAVFGYNHSQAYVDDILARVRAYTNGAGGELTTDADLAAACAAIPAGPANLSTAARVHSPRAFRALPPSALVGGSRSATVDARIYGNVMWILRRYRLRVTAAREAGHRTHGDGTAVDLNPADGTTQAVWDATAGRLAHDLGWTPACGRSGSRPACSLAPAIQFVGYDGYPRHGSPRTCATGCLAHIHVSWVSPCYGSSALSAPCDWIMAFPLRTGSAQPRSLKAANPPAHQPRSRIAQGS
jgi:Transglycosylase SLT domain